MTLCLGVSWGVVDAFVGGFDNELYNSTNSSWQVLTMAGKGWKVIARARNYWKIIGFPEKCLITTETTMTQLHLKKDFLCTAKK